MGTLDSPLTALLLRTGSAVALQLDAEDRLVHLANAGSLQQWLAPDATLPPAGACLRDVLSGLFDEQRVAMLLREFPATLPSLPDAFTCASVPGRVQRLAPARCFDLIRARPDGDAGPGSLLLIIDRSAQQVLADETQEARQAAARALAVLRTEPAALRQLLQTTGSAIGFIRTTLRRPARTQEALREKLQQLRHEAATVTTSAAQLSVDGIGEPAQALVDSLDRLLGMPAPTGDDLLPLALRIDAVAAAAAAVAALDEQRPVSMRATTATRPTQRSNSAWHESCEKRVGELLQRIGNECGVLARLRMKGTALVPSAYHRQIEAALPALVDNALRHGIETPEERLAADKLAAGTVTITFRNRGVTGLEMTVHDDGRGFDVERIRAAVIACELANTEVAATLDARELVGMIFKPGFSTQSLSGSGVTGRSMALLRESLQLRGGNVSVATKPRRYTQFTLSMTDPAGGRRAAARAAAP